MDLTKKSMKWLVAVFVVFAMILTAVFAAGHVATASATENEYDSDVRIWATDSATDLGEYPDLLRSASARTITVYYGFDISTSSQFADFAIAPIVTVDGTTTRKPNSITLNPAFASIAQLTHNTSAAGEYLAASGASSAFYVELTDGVSSDLSAYVNDQWDETKYLFSATYEISANSFGVYELGFGNATAFALTSGGTYFPEIVNPDFNIRAPIAVPVAVAGLTYNTQQQLGVTFANGDPLVDNQNTWLSTDFTLVDNTYIGGTYTGLYEAEFALTDPDTTCWVGNTTMNQTVGWSIGVMEVAEPTLDNEVATYNGGEQSYPASAVTFYTFTGSGTNVGDYDVTVSLDNVTHQNSLVWATSGDDTDLVENDVFTITPAPVTLSFNDNNEGYTSAYGSSLANIEVSASGLFGNDSLGTLGYSAKDANNDPVTLSSATPIGTYTLTTTYTANANYTVTTDTATYVITKKQVTQPTEDNTVFTYNGSAQTYTLATSSDYTITGDTTKTNAGSNNITVALVDKTNTEWATNAGTENLVFTVTIAPKAVTLDFYDSDDEDPWHLTFVATYPDSMYYITVKATGLIGANDLGELGFIATNDMTHAVADITVEGAPAGYYTLTPTYTPNANYDVTALEGTARIYVLDVPVPVVVTDTYNYDGTAKAIVFDEVTSQGYTQYYTITGNSLTEPGTTTVTVALKDEYAGNVIWGYDENVDEYLSTTDDQTFTLTVNAVNVDVKFSVTTGANNTTYYYNYVNNALVATTENEWVAASFDVRDALPAYPTYSFFRTAGWKSGNNVVTAVTAAMSGETQTLNAHYIYNVGAGDVDGDGVITTRDLLKMKRYYIGLETEVLEDAAAAWAAAIAGTAEAPVMLGALDANGSGAFRINDIVTVREALATGYSFRIVIEDGVQQIKEVTVEEVDSYAALVAAVEGGIPAKLANDISAENENFNENISIPAEIDLNGYTLTVNSFSLTSATAGVTFNIKNGTIYAFDGITISAPNGNVKVANATGYTLDDGEVNLAAFTSSLHIDGDVAFYSMHIAKNDVLSAIEYGYFGQQYYDPAPVQIPVDTHVVVEEDANLVISQITVVEAANEQSNVTTFSIEVKSTETDTITVDVTTKVSSEYIVEVVSQSGEIDKIEILSDDNQTVNTDTGVKTTAEFEAAVEAAQDGDTVTLKSDITYGTDYSVAVWAKNFNIDLNGYTFTTNSNVDYTLGNFGYKASALCFSNDANVSNVTIKNGNIVTAYGAGVYIDGLKQTATLEGLNINANTVDVQPTDEYSAALRMTSKAHVTIESGSYKGYNAVAVSNSGGFLTINGGDFDGAVYISAGTGVAKEERVITINGGNFRNCSFRNAASGVLTINGGTFSVDPTAYLADDAIVIEDNGIYHVVSGVARIGYVGYATLVDAIDALEDGDTIVLLKDIDFADAVYADYTWASSYYNVIEIGKNNVTIDLNNHTISNMGNNALTAGHRYAANGRISNFTIKNGSLLGRTETTANGDFEISYALQIAGVDGALVKNVTTRGGINVNSGSTAVVIEDCTVTGTRYYAVCVQKAADATIKNTTITKLYKTVNSYPKALFWIGGVGTDDTMKTDTNTTGAWSDVSSITIESGNITVGAGFEFYLENKPVVKGGTYNVDPTACVATGKTVIATGDAYVVAPVVEVSTAAELDAAMALDAAAITLTDDIALTSYYEIDSVVSIDLNGYTLSTNVGSAKWKGLFNLTAGGVLIVNDSSVGGTGKITATGDYGSVYGIQLRENANATLIVNGGIIEGKYGIYGNNNCGTVVINGGTIRTTVANDAVTMPTGSHLVVNGGTIDGGNKYAINFAASGSTNDTATAIINGGKIISSKTEGAIKICDGSLTITGGDFTETNRIFHKNVASTHTYSIVISGGTFADMSYTNAYDSSATAVTAFLAAGASVTEDSGVYTVTVA